MITVTKQNYNTAVSVIERTVANGGMVTQDTLESLRTGLTLTHAEVFAAYTEAMKETV